MADPQEAELAEVDDVETPETEEQQIDAPAASTDDATEAADEEKPEKRKPRRSTQKRIDQLTRRIHEQEAQIAALSRPAEPEANEAPPKRDDFEDYEEYLDARADYRAQQTAQKQLAEAKKQQSELQREAQQRQQATAFENARAEITDRGAEQFPDFEDVCFADDLQITETMAGAILESDLGHAVWYHLGKNPETAEKIANLSPTRQLIEFGKLESSLSASKRPSGAPPPTKPVGARGPTSNGLRDNLSTDQWIKRRQEEIRKNS